VPSASSTYSVFSALKKSGTQVPDLIITLKLPFENMCSPIYFTFTAPFMILAAILAAFPPPVPPFSTITATATLGSS